MSIALFQSIGLSEAKAKDTLANAAVSKSLQLIINKAKSLCNELDKQLGNKLYQIATRFKGSNERAELLVEYVCNGKLVTEPQMIAAFEYLKSHPLDPVDQSEFSEACGVGVVVTKEEIVQVVTTTLKEFEKELIEKRYKFNVGKLMGALKTKLKWADGKMVKIVTDDLRCRLAIIVGTPESVHYFGEITSILGPRTEQDNAKPIKNNKTNKAKESSNKEAFAMATTTNGAIPVHLTGEALKFHKPGENYLTDGYVVTPKTMGLLEKHLKETKGMVITRFPPEPNGILHIGHAKAINFNFGYARAHNGITYLRYDDTNPEKEEKRFILGIQEVVKWLGHKPYKITYASDYFPELYEFAIELIKRGGAYICHQQHEELKGHNPPPSPWRDRPVEESLQLFEDMRKGKFEEGEATLRMKIIMEDGKQDPVAYRIKYTPHPHSGDKWCVYPTYDFTHCLCDSIENITHSLCTKEFQSRRSSYYWLCNALDLYCPVQWEYGRLNLHYTVVSKRKIQKLIVNNIVSDWDDPRLFTLSALRRRGVSPVAVHTFCSKVGVTMAQATLHPNMFDSCIRDQMNQSATRIMCVLDPLKVTIVNFPNSEPISIEVPNIPHDSTKGLHCIPFDRVIYIDQSDFKEVNDGDYRRLSCDQSVGLRHAGYVITVENIIKDSTDAVIELIAKCQSTSEAPKPKAFIHWVSCPIQCSINLYDRLFLHENPEEVSGGYLTDINPDSLEIKKSLVDCTVRDAPALTSYQFERVGYFCIDYDSTPDNIVFNRTVSLKEDAGKN